jgi:DNA polymerase III delta prime subunit
VIGTCSSRDKFFSESKGVLKPDSDIDETNIKKAAYTNMTTNAVSRLLGLRNLTWEQLKAGNINKEKLQAVDYNSSRPRVEADKLKTLRAIMLEIVDGDSAKASELLYEFTTFQGKDGLVQGKRKLEDISDAQYPMVLKKSEEKLAEKKKAGSKKEEAKAPTQEPPKAAEAPKQTPTAK